MPKLRIRHAFVAVLLLVSLLAQGTWALAGTTGGLSGYVRDPDGVAVSDARVTVTAPSGTSSTSTDNTGHFNFLSLSPDTYTLSVSKAGYQDTSLSGVTVFADQVQSYAVVMPKQLKTIVSVRTTASSLVKSGVGGDIYNVDPSQMQKSAALGGGGNLDSAYSAIASVPGLVIGTGGAGWNQAVVVRGNNPWFTGFEYDGIPINRAFDNYDASTNSNLGLQELQVYTGGGPASISSSGTSGFINQVIKTGTYPGYGTLSGGLAAVGAFYHSARIEAGGASPNRNFSYYVGVGGYNQAFRVIDNQNGASYGGAGSQYGFYTEGLTGNMPTGQAPLGLCPSQGLLGAVPPQGCLVEFPIEYYSNNLLTDRESIVNLHFGIPRHDGQKDDIQLMGSSSAMQTFFDTSPQGGGLNNFMIATTGLPYCPPSGTGFSCAITGGPNYPTYEDVYSYNLPFGSNITPNGVGSPIMPTPYLQPSSPNNRAAYSALPLTQNDLYHNDTGIVKLQLTHPFNSQSFLRLMGYTFFSDWTEDGPTAAYGYDVGLADVSPNYDLPTHTAGGMLQYFNQINDKNLLQFTGNYTHANVNRFNNTGYLTVPYKDLYGLSCPNTGTTSYGLNALCGGSPLGLVSQTNGVYTCYSRTTGAVVPCYSSSYKEYPSYVITNGSLPPITGAAAAAGATWENLYNGPTSGTFNNVTPNFYSASLEDQFRPSEKLTINASIRYDQFNYGLAKAGPQDSFYSQIVQNYSCVNPSNNTVLVAPLTPGSFPPAPAIYTNGNCADAITPGGSPGYVHPDCVGSDPCFTLKTPNVYSMKYWEPRISATYTQNPDTVWRFSAGRYAEPPLSAAVEYLYKGGSGANLWANFMNLGIYSPFHPIPGQTSAQYDGSLEKRLHGTAVSFKISPFYSETSNYEQQSFIGAGFVTQIPVGRARSYGVETQLNYGDFNKEGLSGLVTFTYTKSEVQYQPLLGSSQIQQEQLAINNFDALTQAGGGAACYGPQGGPNAGQAYSCSNPDAIANPYYSMSPVNANAVLPLNGWYPQGETALAGGGLNPSNQSWYNSPFVTNLVLNFRHQKLAITPSMQIQAGSQYGSPYDVVGEDPRMCGANQGTTGTTPGSQVCDIASIPGLSPGAAPVYSFLYVPNPQTGKFASPGQFNQPNLALLNLQLSYDVSPKVTLQLTATNLWHTCWGGTQEPWTTANAPSKNNCGYYSNGLYTSNFYNGTGPTDAAANYGVAAYPWQQQSYLPKFNNSIGGFIPFTLYLQAQVKL